MLLHRRRKRGGGGGQGGRLPSSFKFGGRALPNFCIGVEAGGGGSKGMTHASLGGHPPPPNFTWPLLFYIMTFIAVL